MYATDADDVKRQNVFYNPIQQFNRDLSVLAIKAFSEDWLSRRKSKNSRTRHKGQSRNAKKRKLEVLKDGEQDDNDSAVKQPRIEANGDEDALRPATEASTKDIATAAAGTVSEKDAVVTDDVQTTSTTVGAEQQPGSSQPFFRVLDALSATGLRALRYAKEIPCVTHIVANDMNPEAIKSMEMNVVHNGLSSQITPNIGDAIGHMYSVAYPPPKAHGPQHIYKKYEVIDLDPYGTAAPFVDAALQALSDGGLLCVTCTDSGVFASCGYSEKTYALYGGLPAKGVYGHEVGLRLIINSIATSAAKYGLSIEPLLSLSIDFYARTFIRVKRSPAEVKFLAGKTMIAYVCDSGCGAWTTQSLGRNVRQTSTNGTPWFKHSLSQAPTCDQHCQHCGSKTHVAGPMWAGPIHNAAFIEKILFDLKNADPEVYRTIPRMEGMLSTALEELSVNDAVTQFIPPQPTTSEGETPQPTVALIPSIPPDTIDHFPFFFKPDSLAKVVHCQSPPDAALRGALRHLGYRTAHSHCQRGSFKTDAPWSVLWEIMREWVRQRSPIREGAVKEGTAGWRILQSMRPADVNGGLNGSAGAEDDAGKPGTVVEGGSTNRVTEGVAADGDVTTPDIITDVEQTANATKQKTASTSDAPLKKDLSKLKIVFDEALGKDRPAKRLVRYQQNPRENWGPMTKAKGRG